MTSPERETQLGFSLLELAVVLTILSLLAIGSFTALRISRQQAILEETRAALDYSTSTILAFATIEGYLPCPDTDDNGIEDRDGNNCRNRRGAVPWQTLGIPQVRTQDGWSRPVRYLVTAGMANNSKLQGIRLSSTGDIDPWTGTQQASAITATAFALWSVGEDQKDASADIEGTTPNRVLIPPGQGTAVDDIVTWTSRYTLIARLLEGGRNVPN